ncbi:MAG: hypothetical protein GWM98_16145 [Nitrospinaceae bacterium]|nr:hypothetical protein [Nitrospinaceae bacterium]NIR55735.1 hypothetical protein [Nitrospinaceae bacterium]NIS86175.1 hypothetical protein [Nitrospinaceae bacterium]NIT83014.1 hypothetical protein [Nitrospinaceae bacterium]NIU45226.1 hypothetical protein [Nitrospinaceae bacterium]
MPDSLSSRQSIIHFPARPEYRFSNFIESRGSRFALACAREICSGNPVPYHSLYISGDRGLGKTHLLMAIGNDLAEHHPECPALYIHCRDLTASVDNENLALPGNLGTPETRITCLLLDDIDEIKGHPAVQEALYRIYNQTLESGGKMVFAGRTPPDRLQDTESFITSRFKWGMTAEILPMDDEAIALITHKLAGDYHLNIPDKVVSYLLTRIPRDFQSIKNAVVRINEESLTQKHKVTLPLVKAALGL